MRRIGLAVVLAVSLTLEALAAQAQQAKVPRVGLLMPGTAQEQTVSLWALREGLRDLGYAEGKTLTIEYRWAESRTDRWAELVADLVASKVDVILSPVTASTAAARRATNNIPIVMMANADVVEEGLVQSLAHPGGNITGVVILTSEIVGKRFELLQEVLPRIRRVAYLHSGGKREKSAAEQAGRRLGIQVESLEVRSLTDLEGVLEAAIRSSAAGIVVGSAPLFHRNNYSVVQLISTHLLQTIFFNKVFAEAGGRLSPTGPPLPT